MSGNNWTTDRPTEPGEYWVSLHPDRRTLAASYPVGLERPVERVWIEGERVKTRMGWSMSLTDGWLRYVSTHDERGRCNYDALSLAQDGIDSLPGNVRVVAMIGDRAEVLVVTETL